MPCRETLAHAAAKRELGAVQQPVDWTPPSILRPPEVLTELEVVEAERELKALQRHALEIEIEQPANELGNGQGDQPGPKNFMMALSRRAQF
jgi:hypothetical protein